MGSTGGAGFGTGGLVAEDPTAKTDFKTERVRTALQAGRMLMKWKKTEAAEDGVAQQGYAAAVQALEQGVGEAILQENVPPGYHGSIQSYFDELAGKKKDGK